MYDYFICHWTEINFSMIGDWCVNCLICHKTLNVFSLICYLNFVPDLMVNWKYFQRDWRAPVEGGTTCQTLLGGWRAGDDHDNDDNHDEYGYDNSHYDDFEDAWKSQWLTL